MVSGRKLLFSLTDSLAELCAGGIPLQNAVSLLSERNSALGRCARLLHDALSKGMAFSVALGTVPFLSVPDWYVAYILVSEECGQISPILAHLRNLLLRERQLREKCLSLFAYPCLVLFLTAAAGFLSVFYFLPSFSFLFTESVSQVQKEAVDSILFADSFLLCSFFILVACVRKLLSSAPCLNVIRTMAFLSEHAVPMLQAVSCAFAFVGREKRVSFALLSVRNRLLDGEHIADCFGSCFEKAGFKTEGRVLSEFLYLCEQTGKQNGFARSAKILEEKQSRREKVLLAFLPPILLLLVASYITLILKTAFLPYLTTFGGLL